MKGKSLIRNLQQKLFNNIYKAISIRIICRGFMAIELKSMLPWKKAIDAISSFISEGNFHFSDSGIFFKAIDPSQILLVNLFMDKKHFDSFSVEPTFVGVDLVELSKIMARSLPTDKLRIDLTDSEMSAEMASMLFLKGEVFFSSIN